MIYITGDTHGDFTRFKQFSKEHKTTKEDIMIILGDAGFNFSGGEFDQRKKYYVKQFDITFFCIHGNHEKRPYEVGTYVTKEFCGGLVWYEEEFPDILFAKDGEIYKFGEYECIVIGGAYSIDKERRLLWGYPWFESEQPSAEIKEYVESQLAKRGNKIDVVLSHTCPLKYEPIEVFWDNIDQRKIDKSTEEWLDKIEDILEYKKWYCGHYHTVKEFERIQFMFENIEEFKV